MKFPSKETKWFKFKPCFENTGKCYWTGDSLIRQPKWTQESKLKNVFLLKIYQENTSLIYYCGAVTLPRRQFYLWSTKILLQVSELRKLKRVLMPLESKHEMVMCEPQISEQHLLTIFMVFFKFTIQVQYQFDLVKMEEMSTSVILISGFLDRPIIIFIKVEYEWEGPGLRLL